MRFVPEVVVPQKPRPKGKLVVALETVFLATDGKVATAGEVKCFRRLAEVVPIHEVRRREDTARKAGGGGNYRLGVLHQTKNEATQAGSSRDLASHRSPFRLKDAPATPREQGATSKERGQIRH